jgi:integrase
LDKALRSADRIKAFFGNAKAHTVKGDSVKKFIAQRQAEGAANATINRELSLLKRCFNLGIETEKIVRKPYVAMLEENNVRTGFFERADFIALRNALPDYLKPVVTFAYYTGWRRGEILKLTWAQVDLAGQTVRLNAGTTKNKAGRVIVLEGELLETIKAQWEKRKVAAIPGHSPTLLCPYVFHRNGKRISDPRKAWAEACKETGLGHKLLHDFRRTAVRDMVRAGVPEKVAMSISGHKTRSIFDRYDIVDEADLREAARRHAEHIEKQKIAEKVVRKKRVSYR